MKRKFLFKFAQMMHYMYREDSYFGKNDIAYWCMIVECAAEIDSIEDLEYAYLSHIMKG